MLDLETLGTGPNSMILSIGAAYFDMHGRIGDIFYRTIDLSDAARHSLDIEPSTVKWWMGQDDNARSVFSDPNNVTLQEALDSFSAFYVYGAQVWANSPSFDCVILRNAYQKVGVTCPFPFWVERDVRTICSLDQRFKDAELFEGVAHNSLADCKHQISYLTKTIQQCFRTNES